MFLSPSMLFTAVHLLITRHKKVLLLRRLKTGIYDGFWCLPTGKLEPGESPLMAIQRESQEEVGVGERPSFITAVAEKNTDLLNPGKSFHGLNLFFALNHFAGDVVNKEPDKHDRLEWFYMSDLPTPIIPTVYKGIEQYAMGISYGEYGYE